MAETSPKQGFNLGEFLQKHFLALVILFGIIVFITRKPAAAPGQLISSDTTRTQVLQPIVVNPAYQPTQAGSTIYMPVPQSYQGVIPASTIEELVRQVKDLSTSREALAREYNAVKTYQDSITLKDTAGNRVGVVNLNQRVSENTLKSLQSSYQLLFPKITITNTVAAKLKNQWFIGPSIQSPMQMPRVEAINLNVLIKNKKENIISLSGGYNLQTKLPQVQVGYYPKISFKPKLLPLP